MVRIILFLLGVLMFLGVSAQESIPVKVFSYDAETKALLKHARVSVTTDLVTDKQLNRPDSIAFLVPMDYGTANFSLSLHAENYISIDTLIKLSVSNRSILNQKVQHVTVYLNYDGRTTVEVDIFGSYKPEIVFASDTLSVADFEIDHLGNMFLLTYSKRLSKGGQLIHYDYEKQLVLEKRPLNTTVKGFKRDYRGYVYLEGEETMYYILKTSRITLHRVEKPYFEEFIEPIIDTTEREVFFTNHSPWYPAFDYFGVTLADTVYRNLTHIEDAEIMELYLAEYKYVDVRTKLWAWDMERSTGVDREIWVGAQNFVNSIYYEPAYGPMYQKKDTLYIFDHYRDLMFKVDPFGDFDKDSCAISYHVNARKTGWKKNMLQDDITKNIYCQYDEAGYVTLNEINTDNGTLNQGFKLHHRYVEKVRVINGEVYYVYRPFESMQKKFLYKENLATLK